MSTSSFDIDDRLLRGYLKNEFIVVNLLVLDPLVIDSV
jgi:hypothetical protein